jgi:hypothetical protein
MSAPIGLFVHPVSGYVGIGTTNPRTQLNLTSSGTGNNATILTVGGGGTSSSLGLDFAPDSSRSGGAAAGIRAVGDGAGNAHLTFSTTTGGAATSLVERIRVLSDGNVGIGTVLPRVALDVNGSLKLDSISNYETTLLTLDADGLWYNIGRFDGSYAARLELKIIGSQGYDNTVQSINTEGGGVSYIYCSILNNSTSTNTNISGYYSSVGGTPVIQNVKFVQNGANRFSYYIYALVGSYTAHSVFPTVTQGTGTSATFTRLSISVTDPGADSATIRRAIPQTFAVAGSVGIGTTLPRRELDVNGLLMATRITSSLNIITSYVNNGGSISIGFNGNNPLANVLIPYNGGFNLITIKVNSSGEFYYFGAFYVWNPVVQKVFTFVQNYINVSISNGNFIMLNNTGTNDTFSVQILTIGI